MLIIWCCTSSWTDSITWRSRAFICHILYLKKHGISAIRTQKCQEWRKLQILSTKLWCIVVIQIVYLKRPLSCPRIKHTDLLRVLTTDASDSVGFGSILEVPLEARCESSGFGCHGNANKSSLSKSSSRCNMVFKRTCPSYRASESDYFRTTRTLSPAWQNSALSASPSWTSCTTSLLYTIATQPLQWPAPRLVDIARRLPQSDLVSPPSVRRCSRWKLLSKRSSNVPRPHHPGKVEPFLHQGLVWKSMLFDFASQVMPGRLVASWVSKAPSPL